MDRKYFSMQCKEKDEGYSIEVDDQYPEKLHELHNDLSFLPEGMKLGKIKKAEYNRIKVNLLCT